MSKLRWAALAAACAASLIASDAGATGVPAGMTCQLAVNGRSGPVTVIDFSPPAAPTAGYAPPTPPRAEKGPGPLTVETVYDGRSRALFKDVATGRRVNVQLACSKPGEEITYTLRNAMVTAIQIVASSEVPMERFTFAYTSLQVARKAG